MSPEQEDRERAISLLKHMEAQLTALRREMAALVTNCDAKIEDVRRELALRDKAFVLIHEASQRAIDKSEMEMREKLGIMNEFRSALSDQAGTFVTREHFEDLRNRVEGCATRVEVEATVRARETRFIAAETRLSTVEHKIANYSEERIKTLETWKDNMQGRLWGIPLVIGFVVFVLTQLMRVLFPAK